MNKRILGFDLARAYAIFGMFIVNFTFCFGSFRNETALGKFVNLFIGNSTSIFIICAGMGMMLMVNRGSIAIEGRKKVKSVILKRSVFLFVLGLILYNWWPGDILHFYGGYMHIAAFILFIPKRYYIWVVVLAFVIYGILQFFIPITTSWDLQTTKYSDFWTPIGFIRNTFYNGWNSIFPWFAYFALGMYLGKLDWHNKNVRKKVLLIGISMLVVFKGLRLLIMYDFNNPSRNEFYVKYWFQLMEDYFPVNIPFYMITTGWALIVICISMYLGDNCQQTKILNALAKTGRMTLSHYVIHITLGMLLLSLLTSIKYTGFPTVETPMQPTFILLYSTVFFIFSVVFSWLWSKYFKHGPLEALMRKL